MNVPPFIPQPIEVPGNVAEERRTVCLRFIRRTVTFHFLSAVGIVVVSLLPMPMVPLEVSGAVALALLLVLSMVRNLAKGYPADLKISVALAPIFWFFTGVALGSLGRSGLPVWAIGVGLPFSVAYTFLAGKDHSFMGHFALSLVASSIAIGAVVAIFNVPYPTSAWALAINAVYLSYFVYDLAAILTRRLPREEWGAVVDLYRDVLNVLTYSVRVYKHWKTHRIWSLPK